MQDFGTKADNSPPPGGQLSAAEFNNLATENENAVLRSGQALSGASDTQLAQSMFIHSVKSESFQDSGVANAYVITPISGASGVLLPADYTNLNGAMVSFKASATNTGASTLNFGQTTGTLLGAKSIRTQGDAAIASGSIVAGNYYRLIYNSTFNAGAGAWELLSPTPYTKVITITASGTYTPTPGMKAAFVQVQAAGGGGGGSQGNATGGAAAAGGSAGGYSEGYFTAAQIGASQAVTVGAAGPGGAGPSGTGSAGGASSFGALLTATGGSFGAAGATSGSTARGPAPSVTGGGTGTTQIGQNGGIGIVFGPLNAAIAGVGGSSRLGVGGQGRNEGSNGFTGTGYGAGGAGGASSTINQNGGPGGPGVVIVTEYF